MTTPSQESFTRRLLSLRLLTTSMRNKVKTFLLLVGIFLCLTSLLLPWWRMSASTQNSGYDGHSVGYGVDASANLYSLTGGVGFCRSVGEDDYKIAITNEGVEYWFGWTALTLISLGIILAIVGNNKLRTRKCLMSFDSYRYSSLSSWTGIKLEFRVVSREPTILFKFSSSKCIVRKLR